MGDFGLEERQDAVVQNGHDCVFVQMRGFGRRAAGFQGREQTSALGLGLFEEIVEGGGDRGGSYRLFASCWLDDIALFLDACVLC